MKLSAPSPNGLVKIRSLLFAAAIAVTLAVVPPARADVFYFGLQNISIPTTFGGVYINIDNGATSASPFTGWDINPFFGGFGIANNSAFQPVRTGTSNTSQIVNLATGATVDGSSVYSTGFGGSTTHIGPGANQFAPGTPGYIGFNFTTDGSLGPYYGWMRASLYANTAAGTVYDWAYDTTSSIVTGNIVQATPVAGISTVTLTSTGYGDVFPVNPVARSLCNLETIIGQLYPATLLARLVSLEIEGRR